MHKDWEGADMRDSTISERSHVLMETFYGSPCDFENRPLYFAVRNKEFHFMWKEYRDPTDRLSPESNQLYSVKDDPLQKYDIFNEDHPAVIAGKKIIQARMREIPEISSDRLNALRT